MSPQTLRRFKLLAVALSAAVLAACASGGSGTASRADGGTTGGVNRYLWTASLETMDFMPLFSVDPVAGVILTDWYANPQVPTERFKANVFILDTALRADALRVSVFRQQLLLDETGQPLRDDQGRLSWTDAPVNPATAAELENAILTRARELRLNSLS
ncbi:DUF3576 domain-containing protein [Parvularcula dongshanensis]|uniref:DUF3576 domain-containing protein n=1 Tax=Parvularcula dongshanensis TaxID=1173995 RepID=A0A840I1H1_9PROT|nr:DUF3576 domain-containing protein [Parvularcula dongshanensis]MBB4658072.1 hypothetical protein [Parvularcula dongshanensis]